MGCLIDLSSQGSPFGIARTMLDNVFRFQKKVVTYDNERGRSDSSDGQCEGYPQGSNLWVSHGAVVCDDIPELTILRSSGSLYVAQWPLKRTSLVRTGQTPPTSPSKTKGSLSMTGTRGSW